VCGRGGLCGVVRDVLSVREVCGTAEAFRATERLPVRASATLDTFRTVIVAGGGHGSPRDRLSVCLVNGPAGRGEARKIRALRGRLRRGICEQPHEKK